jgi:hypothetical protein
MKNKRNKRGSTADNFYRDGAMNGGGFTSKTSKSMKMYGLPRHMIKSIEKRASNGFP